MNDVGPQEQTYLQAKLSYLHRFQPSEAFYWIGLFRSVNMSTMEDHWLWTNGTVQFLSKTRKLIMFIVSAA